MSRRLSININDATAKALQEIAADKGLTVTEVIRRAVFTYEFFDKATAGGKQIRVIDDEAGVQTEVALVG